MFVCAFHGVSPQVVRLAEMASEREPWMACQFREREWSSFVRPKRSISPRARAASSEQGRETGKVGTAQCYRVKWW